MPCLGCWAVISIIAMNIRTSPKMGGGISPILPFTSPILGRGQKVRDLLLCPPRMKNKELNKLMGSNLRKLRIAANFTQDDLSEQIGVTTRVLQRWEIGKKGIGKNVLINLCDVFGVKPYMFYVDEKALFVTRSRECAILKKLRVAERLGVIDFIEQFSDFTIAQAAKVNKTVSNGRLKSGDAPVRLSESIER
jgi:transcriptional regulator with XRE-family HTH domain